MAYTENTPQQLFDLLISKNFEVKTLDKQGSSTIDPSEAEMFSFDFTTPDKNYGTVVILLDSESNLEVFYGNNIVEVMSANDKSRWYDFLYQLRMFAKRNTKQFSLNNLNRLKYRMQSLAAIQESLFEGYYGTKKTSYQDQPQKTRLIIKHSKNLGETDARFRNISSLFVENSEGERFKLPFKNISAGRAMSRHVAEGGNPYDTFGQHISEVVSQISLLSEFTRSSRNRNLSESAKTLYDLAEEYKDRLRKRVKRMASRRGYHKYIEEWQPSDIEPHEEVVEDIRKMFSNNSIDSRVENAAPLLAKLQQEYARDQQSELSEITEFRDWAESITEGTWELPDNDRKKQLLRDLFSDKIVVGPDALNVTERLHDVFGDDKLYDDLGELSRNSPDADARPLIQRRLKEFGIEIAGVTDVDIENIDEEHDLDTGEIITSSRREKDKKAYYGNAGSDAIDESSDNMEDTGIDDLKRLMGLTKH